MALAESCLRATVLEDGRRGRSAHSCGAVADFHRLPEHPGEFRDDFAPSRRGAAVDVIEQISTTSTFITGQMTLVKAGKRT